MKLYLFQCGRIRAKKHLVEEGPVSEERLDSPVPFYLIEHPAGRVLFDTGQPFSAITLTTGNYITVMSQADHVSNQLKRIGLTTADITHIVLSHLHSDHAGGLEAFSKAVCYVQEDELHCQGSDSVLQQFPLRWQVLQGRKKTRYDIFGDSRLQIVFTPGHSPGHQSLFVKLQKWGDTFLTADSSYTDRILDKEVLPGVYHDLDDTIRTIEMISTIRRGGARVITGHDPHSWKNYRLAPAYYE